jgi:hypothetical protein
MSSEALDLHSTNTKGQVQERMSKVPHCSSVGLKNRTHRHTPHHMLTMKYYVAVQKVLTGKT